MTRTIAVIQARLGSTRLPGKVLMPVLGEPMLTHVVRRVARAKTIDEVVIATTTLERDDAIEVLARVQGWGVVRGSEDDVLARYAQAARTHAADVIVRVTSDCPMIDPDVVDLVVGTRAQTGADYASNTLEPRTYPRGLDTEAFTRDALELANAEDANPAWREHVTPYLYFHPERFHIEQVEQDGDDSRYRWSVDTEADMELVRRIFDAFATDTFGWRNAIALLSEHPDWSAINQDVVQKVVGA